MKLYKFAIIATCLLCSNSCKEKSNATLQEVANQEVDSLLQNGKLAEKSNLDAATVLFQQGLQIAHKQEYIKGIFTAYRYLTFNTGILQSNFEESFSWNNKGLAEAQQINNQRYIGDMLSMRAMLYHAKSDLDSAVFYYKKAITILEANQANEALLPLYNNISGLYNLLGNNRYAKNYLQLYINLVIKQKDTASLIGAYSNMYLFTSALQDTAGGIAALYKAKSILDQYPSNGAAPMLYLNLSDMYLNKKQFDSALYFANLRVENARALKDTLGIIKSYNAIIQAKLGLKNIAAAAEDMRALKIYSKSFTAPIYQQRNSARLDYLIHKEDGNSVAAFRALEKYDSLNTNIREMEINKDLENFENERQRNNQENKLLNKELQLHRKDLSIILLWISVVILVGIGLALLFWFRKKQDLQKKQIAFLEKEKEWSHSKSLLEGQLRERNRISMELHDDLGASLTAIALASKIAQHNSANGNAEELKIIASSSAEMVQTLNEIVWTLNSGNNSLQSLVAYIRKFATSFLSNANIKFSCSITLPPQDILVGTNTRRSIYLSTKEAFNNLVKHSTASEASLLISLQGDSLSLIIKDNGKGFKSDTLSGNGCQNMLKNMKQINGTFEIKQQKGTEIILTCPIVED